MTAIRSVLGPHWDLFFDYIGGGGFSLTGECFLSVNPFIIIGGPSIYTADLSFYFDLYKKLIVFHKIARDLASGRFIDDGETLRRYIIIQPQAYSLTAESDCFFTPQSISKILAEIERSLLLLSLFSIGLSAFWWNSLQILPISSLYSSALFASIFDVLAQVGSEINSRSDLSFLFDPSAFLCSYGNFLSYLLLIPTCILPSVQEIIGSLNLKLSSLSFLFLSLITSQDLEIDSAYFSESVTVPKLLLHIQPWLVSSQRFTESLEVEFIRKALLHSSSSFAEPLSIETAFHSDFKSVMLSSLYLQPFVILPGIISLIIYQALSLLFNCLSEEYDVYQSDLKIQPYTAFMLWYFFSESLKWQLRSQTIQRFVEETALTFGSSAPQLPMFVYTALTLLPSAEFTLPTPPARYPTFYDFVGSAWIFRKSFWHTYQKGWIDKDNVDETTYKRVGLQYPEGYEKLDRREKRKEIKIKTRRKKELSLEELNELL